MQLMAVAAGGALEQHMPDLVGHDEHSPGGDAFGATEVTTADESRLRSLVGDRPSRSAATTTRPCATHPGFERDRLGRRRLARGDGATRASASASASSGTRRCGDDASLFAGLVAAAAG